MPSEREEMIGFLLARIDERDKLIANLKQQLKELGVQPALRTLTEHLSTMAPAGRSQEKKDHGNLPPNQPATT